jgi:hypothetical protein
MCWISNSSFVWITDIIHSLLSSVSLDKQNPSIGHIAPATPGMQSPLPTQCCPHVPVSSASSLPASALGNHKSAFLLCCFSLFRMFYDWNHTLSQASLTSHNAFVIYACCVHLWLSFLLLSKIPVCGQSAVVSNFWRIQIKSLTENDLIMLPEEGKGNQSPQSKTINAKDKSESMKWDGEIRFKHL